MRRYKDSRYFGPAVSKPELPGFDLLSVVAIGSAVFSLGTLVTQAFPHAQMSREYLALLAQGHEWLGAVLETTAGLVAVYVALTF